MTWDPGIGAGVQVMDILQMKAALYGYHLGDPQNDCQVSVEGSLSVSITSGNARLGGRFESVSSQTESLPNPDTDNPRKALVYLDSSGNLNTLGGDPTPAQPDGEIRDKTFNPSVPVPDEDFLPLAEVWMEENADSIVENDIISRRMPFSMGDGSGLNADRWKGEDSLGYDDIDGTLPHHDLSSVGSSDHHSRPSSTNTASSSSYTWTQIISEINEQSASASGINESGHAMRVEVEGGNSGVSPSYYNDCNVSVTYADFQDDGPNSTEYTGRIDGKNYVTSIFLIPLVPGVDLDTVNLSIPDTDEYFDFDVWIGDGYVPGHYHGI